MAPLSPNGTAPSETLNTAIYVDGHEHSSFAIISAYYTHWFKNGAPPTILSPAVFFWHRGHTAQATATNDPLPRPDGADSFTDTIFVDAFIPDDSTATQVVVTSAFFFFLPFALSTDHLCFRAAGGEATDPQSVSPGVNMLKTTFTTGATYVVSRLFTFLFLLRQSSLGFSY